MTRLRNRLTELNRETKNRVVDHVHERLQEPMVRTPFHLAKTGVRPRK